MPHFAAAGSLVALRRKQNELRHQLDEARKKLALLEKAGESSGRRHAHATAEVRRLEAELAHLGRVHGRRE